MTLSMHRIVKSAVGLRIWHDHHQNLFLFPMRLSWPQHLQASRTLEAAADAQRGMALALMGISLLILAEDLLEEEQRVQTVPPGCSDVDP